MTSLSTSSPIPILLLKTRSIPQDGYNEEFATPKDGVTFTRTFVPVLEHKILEEGKNDIREVLVKKQIGDRKGCKYGGLIFTSQRAVEAFGMLIEEGRKTDPEFPHLSQTPIYTVGPATSRALSSLPTTPPLSIHGSQTGNGEALAHYILTHYPSLFPITTYLSPSASDPNHPLSTDYKVKYNTLPLLFIVGETRRDIIPLTLMNAKEPIEVREIPVYGTSVMGSFERDFEGVLDETRGMRVRWVVVFSPTGCEGMLRALGLLDPSTKRVVDDRRRDGNGDGDGGKTYIASIGPTTRDYLKDEFGFTVDVCAERPSPEGVREGIRRFVESL